MGKAKVEVKREGQGFKVKDLQDETIIMLILFILSKVAELLQVFWIIYMQRFNIKRPRVFFCAFLKDISSCLTYAFFSR